MTDRLKAQAEEADVDKQVMAAQVSPSYIVTWGNPWVFPQMATYKEDFTEERMARESMASEGARLRELLDSKAQELESLRRQLNEQARDTLQSHVSVM